MKRRGWAKVYSIMGVALMIIFAGKEPIEIYASFNAAVPGETASESGTESSEASLPEESVSTEGGNSSESMPVGQDEPGVQQGDNAASSEVPSDSVQKDGAQSENTGSQEPVSPESSTEGGQTSDQGEGSNASSIGSASIVGGSYVELEEEIHYEGSAVSSIERSGGTFVAGTLCSSEPVTYTIHFTGEVTEDAHVRYQAGALEETAPIVDNTAAVTLSTGAGDHLQMWYATGEGENLFLEAYVVIEQQAPEISYERITREDGKQYAHIIVMDAGENLSGIKECQFTVDGQAYIPEEITQLEMHAMPGGAEVPVKQEVDIPLEGHETHEIQAEILDNAGNPTLEIFSMKALPEGVVSVVLPTSFRIAIRPYEIGENVQIYSDDVVICNKSEFPVDVEVSSVEVEINHATPEGKIVTKRVPVSEGGSSDVLDLTESMEVPMKDCKINFKLREAGKEPLLLLLAEGNNEDVARFTLEAGQEGTNSQELMGQRYVDMVASSDYAIINICGDLSEGSGDLWRSEDLVVRLVFQFHRKELTEEPEGVRIQEHE